MVTNEKQDDSFVRLSQKQDSLISALHKKQICLKHCIHDEVTFIDTRMLGPGILTLCLIKNNN